MRVNDTRNEVQTAGLTHPAYLVLVNQTIGYKTMRIKPLASNMTELLKIDGTVVLFSYETPVAALLPSGRYVRTSKKWSQTTTRHINKWLVGVTSPVEEVQQDFFDTMIEV